LVRIRLRRLGAKKRPFYRVVVTDQRHPRDGRFLENIGKYHPMDDPSLIEIDEDRALEWLSKGAQPSDTVRTLMTKVGIWDKFLAASPKRKAIEANLKKQVESKAKKMKARAASAPKPPKAKEPVAAAVAAAPAESAAAGTGADAAAEPAAEAAPES
jgi:small subunit ribosomal protein S16